MSHSTFTAPTPPPAVDLSGHLSRAARERAAAVSNEKFVKRPGNKDLIDLDGGHPPPEYYPFQRLRTDAQASNAFESALSLPRSSSDILSWLSGKKDDKLAAHEAVVPLRQRDPSEGFELLTAFDYSPITGLPLLASFIRSFVGRVHKPAYADWGTLVNIGSTYGIDAVFDLLLDPGDGWLTDEYTYSGAIAQGQLKNLRSVGVPADSDGVLPNELVKVLEEWDEAKRGFKRPHVFYTVSAAQNPTGITLPAERKKALLAVASKFDLIIIEDDPYYFEQAGPYSTTAAAGDKAEATDAEWLDSLQPSFLRYDTEGRVIRLDTFSKTFGPGSRLGFFTTSPVLLKHLQLAASATTQFPSGLTQALIGQLLLDWGQDGYIRWLRGLTNNYKSRRDNVLKFLASEFHTAYSPEGEAVVRGFVNEAAEQPLVSWTQPAGGMFVWIRVHLAQHPSFVTLSSRIGLTKTKQRLNDGLYFRIQGAGVRLRAGELFAADSDEVRDERGETDGFLRLSYSTAEASELLKAVKIIAKEVKGFFEEEISEQAEA